MQNNKPQAHSAFFCTYKNGTTNGWQKSREYKDMPSLLDAMKVYLSKYPTTTVQFQTRTVWY